MTWRHASHVILPVLDSRDQRLYRDSKKVLCGPLEPRLRWPARCTDLTLSIYTSLTLTSRQGLRINSHRLPTCTRGTRLILLWLRQAMKS